MPIMRALANAPTTSPLSTMNKVQVAQYLVSLTGKQVRFLFFFSVLLSSLLFFFSFYLLLFHSLLLLYSLFYSFLLLFFFFFFSSFRLSLFFLWRVFFFLSLLSFSSLVFFFFFFLFIYYSVFSFCCSLFNGQLCLFTTKIHTRFIYIYIYIYIYYFVYNMHVNTCLQQAGPCLSNVHEDLAIRIANEILTSPASPEGNAYCKVCVFA